MINGQLPPHSGRSRPRWFNGRYLSGAVAQRGCSGAAGWPLRPFGLCRTSVCNNAVICRTPLRGSGQQLESHRVLCRFWNVKEWNPFASPKSHHAGSLLIPRRTPLGDRLHPDEPLWRRVPGRADSGRLLLEIPAAIKTLIPCPAARTLLAEGMTLIRK